MANNQDVSDIICDTDDSFFLVNLRNFIRVLGIINLP